MFAPLDGTAAEGTIVRFSTSADDLSLYAWSGDRPCDAPTSTTYHYTAQNLDGSGVTLEIVAADCQFMFFSVVDPAEDCNIDHVFTLHIEQSPKDLVPSETTQSISVGTEYATMAQITRTARPSLVTRLGLSPTRTKPLPRGSSGASSTNPRPTCLEKPLRPTYCAGSPSLTSRQPLIFPTVPPARPNVTSAFLGASPSMGALPATGGSESINTPYMLVIALIASHAIYKCIFL
jgi:hypothetical protein